MKLRWQVTAYALLVSLHFDISLLSSLRISFVYPIPVSFAKEFSSILELRLFNLSMFVVIGDVG
jgi:hypothetical protein